MNEFRNLIIYLDNCYRIGDMSVKMTWTEYIEILIPIYTEYMYE
jgi:preprotein translocase subunit Sss1